MKIAFKKVGFNKKDITIKSDRLSLHGSIRRGEDGLVAMDATLDGTTEVECIRCGEIFTKVVDEKLSLKFSDGCYKGFDEEADVIEFYDGVIDFDEVVKTEAESIKLDYHLCPKCQKEGE